MVHFYRPETVYFIRLLFPFVSCRRAQSLLFSRFVREYRVKGMANCHKYRKRLILPDERRGTRVHKARFNCASPKNRDRASHVSLAGVQDVWDFYFRFTSGSGERAATRINVVTCPRVSLERSTRLRSSEKKTEKANKVRIRFPPPLDVSIRENDRFPQIIFNIIPCILFHRKSCLCKKFAAFYTSISNYIKDYVK